MGETLRDCSGSRKDVHVLKNSNQDWINGCTIENWLNKKLSWCWQVTNPRDAFADKVTKHSTIQWRGERYDGTSTRTGPLESEKKLQTELKDNTKKWIKIFHIIPGGGDPLGRRCLLTDCIGSFGQHSILPIPSFWYPNNPIIECRHRSLTNWHLKSLIVLV